MEQRETVIGQPRPRIQCRYRRQIASGMYRFRPRSVGIEGDCRRDPSSVVVADRRNVDQYRKGISPLMPQMGLQDCGFCGVQNIHKRAEHRMLVHPELILMA
jgi:hypothetical protein